MTGNSTINDSGNNIIGDTTGVGEYFTNSSLLGSSLDIFDPLFVEPVLNGEPLGGDLRLMQCSPAVNAGDITGYSDIIGLTDLAGESRVIGSKIDIGAYEFQVITGPDCSSSFVTIWKTNNLGSSANNQITIPTFFNLTYDYTVNWGDGSTSTNVTGDTTHTYSTSGVYTVSISGTFPGINFEDNGDKLKLLSIEQWGETAWESFNNSFYGCRNLEITNQNIDVPNLSNVTDMNSMFRDCINFNADISNWDVSNVQLFNHMFHDADAFNQDINDWNTIGAISMVEMFAGTNEFNKPLNGWNISNVIDLRGMFSLASEFNQDLDEWNTINVEDMSQLFFEARNFNGNISTWNVNNVEDMSDMFESALLFNQDISNWETDSVTDMSAMFKDARDFNQSIGNWNVSNVTTMRSMFAFTNDFNNDLSNWDVSKVTTMQFMFNLATGFDQSLGDWNLSSLVDNGFSGGLRNFLRGTSISVTNYDATLIGWNTDASGTDGDGIDDIPSDIVLDAGSSEYCNGKEEQQDLIDTYNWTIEDGGVLDEC